jgi:hypothetical protein
MWWGGWRVVDVESMKLRGYWMEGRGRWKTKLKRTRWRMMGARSWQMAKVERTNLRGQRQLVEVTGEWVAVEERMVKEEKDEKDL